MEKLKWIYETLENCIADEIGKGLDSVDTEEMGKAVDMLKDITQAMYYKSVAENMEVKRPNEITLDMIDRE